MLLIYFYQTPMQFYSDNHHSFVYNIDASHLIQNENVEVFLPENKDDIIAIVKKAIDENKRIICRAWWTNLVGNCLPSDGSYVIDFSNYNAVIDKDWSSITLQPWITNDKLNELLKLDGLYFPVVLWSHASAEIWGMIATNWAGMRAIKYGKMENRVEELEVLYVDEKNEIRIERLSEKEKNDFLWSEWKIWIVLEAKLRVIPLPWKTSMEFKGFENVKEALAYVMDVKSKNTSDLSALELLSPQVAEYLNLEKKYYILVEYENEECWEIKDEGVIRELRGKRDACYAVTINAWYDQIEDPEINIENAEEFFLFFEENNIPIFWHIWIWVLHPHFKSSQKDLGNKMYELVQKLWWSVSWEHWIGKKKWNYLSEQDKKHFMEIKLKRDPTNRFWYE